MRKVVFDYFLIHWICAFLSSYINWASWLQLSAKWMQVSLTSCISELRSWKHVQEWFLKLQFQGSTHKRTIIRRCQTALLHPTSICSICSRYLHQQNSCKASRFVAHNELLIPTINCIIHRAKQNKRRNSLVKKELVSAPLSRLMESAFTVEFYFAEFSF